MSVCVPVSPYVCVREKEREGEEKERREINNSSISALADSYPFHSRQAMGGLRKHILSLREHILPLLYHIKF